VRENKTYDAELGSVAGANGDPSLEIFGGDMTPNLHRLASDFVNLDNYYIAAEASLQGHVLTTSAFVNDFAEKAWLQTWGRAWRSEVTFGGSMNVPSGFVWGSLKQSKISYTDMGESVGLSDPTQGLQFDPSYPGVFFTLDVSDADRATYFERSLARGSTP